MIAEQLALVCSTLFAGAALHITLSEQPARLALDDAAMLAQWKTSFGRAQRMAPPLAILGFLFSAFSWWQTGGLLWVIGAILIGVNIPYTLVLIMPTNRKLLATAPNAADLTSRALIADWGRMHDARTALALAATAVMTFQAANG